MLCSLSLFVFLAASVDAVDDTTPPLIFDIGVVNQSASSVTVSWTTEEVSDSQVAYGPTSAYGSLTDLYASMTMSHSILIADLTPGTLYHFSVFSKDPSGNLSSSEDGTFTTPIVDVTEPTIFGISVSSIDLSSATIEWTTNEASDSQVEYGLTEAYGSASVLDAGMVLSHTVSLTGLAQGTLYHYRVRSADVSANLAISLDDTFITDTVVDLTAPAILEIAARDLTGSSVSIEWTTDETSDSQVEYGLTASYGHASPLNPSQVLSHSVAISGLMPNTLYHYRVFSADASANSSISGDETFTTTAIMDVTAPVLSAVAVGGITGSSAAITWTSDEASDSQVEYGLTTAYGSVSTLSTSLDVLHGVTISGLLANTAYHFRVRSADASANVAISDDNTFVTSAAPSVPTGSSGVSGSAQATCGAGSALGLLAMVMLLGLQLRPRSQRRG